MNRVVLTLVTARRPGGPGVSPHNHLTLNGNLVSTLCGLQVRSPINHVGDTQKLADCANCQRSLRSLSR